MDCSCRLIGSRNRCILENEVGACVFYVYSNQSETYTLFSQIPKRTCVELQMTEFNNMLVQRHGSFIRGCGSLCCHLLILRCHLLLVIMTELHCGAGKGFITVYGLLMLGVKFHDRSIPSWIETESCFFHIGLWEMTKWFLFHKWTL